MKIALAFLFLFSPLAWAATLDCGSFTKATAAGSAPQRLKRYIDTNWKYTMQEYPT